MAPSVLVELPQTIQEVRIFGPFGERFGYYDGTIWWESLDGPDAPIAEVTAWEPRIPGQGQQ